MGALGAIVVTAIGGRMSWSVLRETTYATTRITAMMMFILMCAQAFSLSFRGFRANDWCRISSNSCPAASMPTSGS